MSMCVRAVSPYMYIYAIEMNTRPACTLGVIKCALFLGSRKEEGIIGAIRTLYTYLYMYMENIYIRTCCFSVIAEVIKWTCM